MTRKILTSPSLGILTLLLFKKSLFVILYELLVLNCNNETNVKNVSISPNVMFDFCTEIS